MKIILVLFLLLILSGCKSMNSNFYETTIEGSGVNDSHIIEAKTMVIENGETELK